MKTSAKEPYTKQMADVPAAAPVAIVQNEPTKSLKQLAGKVQARILADPYVLGMISEMIKEECPGIENNAADLEAVKELVMAKLNETS